MALKVPDEMGVTRFSPLGTFTVVPSISAEVAFWAVKTNDTELPRGIEAGLAVKLQVGSAGGGVPVQGSVTPQMTTSPFLALASFKKAIVSGKSRREL